MYKIEKEFHFSAAHQLAGLPPEHPCSRLHGHNYIIVAVLESMRLNDVGFVVDYRELDAMKKWIDDNLDHRNMNEVFVFNPTAELMARKIYEQFKPMYPLLVAIKVKETPKTEATYAPGYDNL